MKYLAKKLAGFVMTMLVVSFLVFAAFAVIPGDPATAMLKNWRRCGNRWD